MDASTALKIIADFKGNNLKQNLNVLRGDLIGKGKNQITEPLELFEAALVVKKLSAQIDEMVHASGIIKCLPLILDDAEIILSLSLAAGADGEGIDLVTNKRIAEFKFSRWQDKVANGSRKRQVFADLVSLYLNDKYSKKELYVYNADKVINFFKSEKAQWKNVLSKSGGLDKRLEEFLKLNKIDAKYINDIFIRSEVTVIDIDTIFKELNKI